MDCFIACFEDVNHLRGANAHHDLNEILIITF